MTEAIRYIGINDHKIDLFEGQYRVPRGMSYNSYMIIDEKIAVMDTVDKRFTHEWLDNIAGALGVGMKAAWYRPGLTDHAGSNAAGKNVRGKDNAVNGTAGTDAAEIRTPWTDSRGVIIFRSFRELPAVIRSL